MQRDASEHGLSLVLGCLFRRDFRHVIDGEEEGFQQHCIDVVNWAVRKYGEYGVRWNGKGWNGI